MVADRIKHLREQANMTQAELARKLGISRSSVNAWEIGISVPSTQYIMELAAILHVSTDFLLGVEPAKAISVSGLTDSDIEVVHTMNEHLRTKNVTNKNR